MSLRELHGQVVHIGPDCGVQFASGRDLLMRVAHTEDSKYWDGMAYLTGYILGPTGNAIDHRQVYVIVAGLRTIVAQPDPRTRNGERPARAARNAGPAVPRPRTSPETTITGRTR